MSDMKKLLKETLIEKNALFFATSGVSAAVIASSSITTAAAVALSVLLAVALASTASAFVSRITGRLGVWTVYIAVCSGIMASLSSALSNLIPDGAEALATSLLLASVGGIVISGVPKQNEIPTHSIVRASLTVSMYALMVVLLSLLRHAIGAAVEFAASPSMTLIVMGFIVAGVNFLFVSIAERKERAAVLSDKGSEDEKTEGEEERHDD